jgi:hypothetical protein
MINFSFFNFITIPYKSIQLYSCSKKNHYDKLYPSHFKTNRS